MTPFKSLIAHAALDRRDPATLRDAAWAARAARSEVVGQIIYADAGYNVAS